MLEIYQSGLDYFLGAAILYQLWFIVYISFMGTRQWFNDEFRGLDEICDYTGFLGFPIMEFIDDKKDIDCNADFIIFSIWQFFILSIMVLIWPMAAILILFRYIIYPFLLVLKKRHLYKKKLNNAENYI